MESPLDLSRRSTDGQSDGQEDTSRSLDDLKTCIAHLESQLMSSAVCAHLSWRVRRMLHGSIIGPPALDLDNMGANHLVSFMTSTQSILDRLITEMILHHQDTASVSGHLWMAVRSHGCQFLGPAMQEEVLRLLLLALQGGAALSRKVLVMFVVSKLQAQYSQASKTAIGHVVQLLYRASCFTLIQRDNESSLMRLRDEFNTYETLSREHDSQIIQISMEAGLRIAPEQWSALLYGDHVHKSHMQSILDKLQTTQSLSQNIKELEVALRRCNDPNNLLYLCTKLTAAAQLENREEPVPSLCSLHTALSAVSTILHSLTTLKKKSDTVGLSI